MAPSWIAIGLALAVASSPGRADAPARAVAPVDLYVIAHEGHPGASASDLELLFLRREQHWPNGDLALPLNLVPESRDRQRFDRAVLGMSPDEVSRYWLDARIRGGRTPPREIADPDLAARLVSHVKGAIAYVPPTTDLRGTLVVARISNGKVSFP